MGESSYQASVEGNSGSDYQILAQIGGQLRPAPQHCRGDAKGLAEGAGEVTVAVIAQVKRQFGEIGAGGQHGFQCGAESQLIEILVNSAASVGAKDPTKFIW